MKSIHRINVFRHLGAGRGPVADSRLDSGLRRNDYGCAVMFATLLAGFMRPIATAQAHESPVPHQHPHLQTLDGALMGYEAFALIAIVFAAATGLTLLLARARRRK